MTDPYDPYHAPVTQPPEALAPSTGVPQPQAERLKEVPTPDIRGTLVLNVLLLMGIFGFWVLMYLELLSR